MTDELFDFVGTSGVHVIMHDNSGDLSSHCVVTERTFWIGEHGPMKAGYIDAVATRPTKQGLGYGRAVMAESCRVCKSIGMNIMGLSTFIPE
ncbi:GNAT family N-acetyltransferase [Dethiosulfovibrio peptidovorans]|uniref:GNAT family N-acetyltransferase n=1 Tax=Dethiosulfovibrio peptidovorans TaxID=47055 RepID=UPI00019E4FA9